MRGLYIPLRMNLFVHFLEALILEGPIALANNCEQKINELGIESYVTHCYLTTSCKVACIEHSYICLSKIIVHLHHCLVLICTRLKKVFQVHVDLSKDECLHRIKDILKI